MSKVVFFTLSHLESIEFKIFKWKCFEMALPSLVSISSTYVKQAITILRFLALLTKTFLQKQNCLDNIHTLHSYKH